MKEWECPVCHGMTDKRPALSRRDNETNICSECGTKESLQDYLESKDMHCPTCECDEESK